MKEDKNDNEKGQAKPSIAPPELPFIEAPPNEPPPVDPPPIPVSLPLFGQDEVLAILRKYPQLIEAFKTAWWGVWWGLQDTQRGPLTTLTRANFVRDHFRNALANLAAEPGVEGLEVIVQNPTFYILVDKVLLIKFKSSDSNGVTKSNDTERARAFAEQDGFDIEGVDKSLITDYLYLTYYVPHDHIDSVIAMLVVRPNALNRNMWVEVLDFLDRTDVKLRNEEFEGMPSADDSVQPAVIVRLARPNQLTKESPESGSE